MNTSALASGSCATWPACARLIHNTVDKSDVPLRMRFRKCLTARLQPLTAVFRLILRRRPDHKTHLLSTARCPIRSRIRSDRTPQDRTSSLRPAAPQLLLFLHFSLPPLLKVSNCFGSYYYRPITAVRQSQTLYKFYISYNMHSFLLSFLCIFTSVFFEIFRNFTRPAHPDEQRSLIFRFLFFII